MDYTAQRNKMVDNQIRTTDVTSHSVLNAFLSVPRESFVADRLKPLAYSDNDLEIAPGRYLMEPSPLAKLIQLAGIRKTDNVLEIGAGSGYGSALLAELAGSVVALESDAALVEVAKANLAGCPNVAVVAGTLSAGHAGKAPYDVILVSGSVDQVPDSLFSQLKEGGRLVVVIGQGLSSSARIFVREQGTQSERFAFNTSVRKLPGFDKAAEFIF
ncbi:protein-L-isoaspartate O-methyltransferase [Rhizobium sp. KVB221]|uniref:Protein-L-isoaspartate O-methyltransferase n=1 Tax=Rhizobium setariae TaxID=2801340 RepID=A0A936YM21_9HYPH|nr:protein-L-isoaspartate O-methyltransferase [Rhizobium setariae]MBL0372868.1 protein-L-isoaspartate O-methyltransferase [Rhizobium setariae]